MIKGQIISGEFGKIKVRQKSDSKIELGEILVSEYKGVKILSQAYDLQYGSQISDQNLELISGLKLEEETDFELFDEKLRNYNIAFMKSFITIKDDQVSISKDLPPVFSEVREVAKNDLTFLRKPNNALLFGKLRSGSKTLDVEIYLQGDKVFSHHILISGTTGRGKSVLVANLLWVSADKDYCGVLVLDPHDEYYGRGKLGLKDHPSKKVVYYTPRAPPLGARSLKINLEILRPQHFEGVVDFSDPQKQALNMFFKKYGKKWIEAVITEKTIDGMFRDDTLSVIRRRLLYILDLEFNEYNLICNGIFDAQAGFTTISDISKELEKSNVVIIDTSSFSGQQEILIGTLIATEIFNKYKHYKLSGELENKPVISIVLEEAPRVLGKEILEKGGNIFSTIAREGRKFKVGLTAITQIPSLIPRDILANINTKIILGMEMAPERQAIIDSAAQDLSNDSRNIAALDVGEAILTSNFSKFAIPLRISSFEDNAKDSIKKITTNSFDGVGLE